MPPKASTSATMSSDEDKLLQAVILADTYNERLKPLTVNQPRCLLPICNAALLDWTLESLSLAGVHEVFVVCTAHADLIKETLAASKWSKPSSGLKITPICTDPSCFAPGEALRDVYTHGVITSDFVLVFGDLVSNVRLDEVVKAHKARVKENKDAIMTMVVMEAGSQHGTRPLGDGGIFVLDEDTGECLHYEAVAGVPLKKGACIPMEAISQHRHVEVRNDLIDCGIDICSVEVLSLFQDNFDYLDIRRDFVRGVLTSDLLGKSIYCHVIKDGYAARVKDGRSYDMISKNILMRWTYPLVPDENNPSGQAYEHRKGNVYMPAAGKAVHLSRSCKIGRNSLIGENTTIKEDAQISNSVLGRNCVIGANAVVRNSYLWDGVTVGEKCVIENSIVGKNVVLLEKSMLSRGCLVGDHVTLGPGAMLPEFCRVATEGADGEKTGSMGIMLGARSNGVVWPSLDTHIRSYDEQDDDDDDDEVADELETPQNLRLLRMGDETSLEDLQRYEPDSSSSEEEESSSSSSGEEDAEEDVASTRSSVTSTPSIAIALKLNSIAEAEFQKEVAASLERAWAEGHTVDNAAVELKTLRMASNVPLRRVREAIVGFLLDKIESGAGDNRELARRVVGRWGGLINAIGGVDAVETVEVLQRVCAEEARFLNLFGLLLGAFYEDDIIEEDDVRDWHARPASRGDSATPPGIAATMERCWMVGTKMIEQFDEQETESEESG